MAEPEGADDDAGTGAAGPATLPEAAARRLQLRSFTSALSVNEFAACLHLGLRPVGMVQGFCAMRWLWRDPWMTGSTYSSYYGSGRYRTRTITNYTCPHGWGYGQGADHRRWGANLEVLDVGAAWDIGFGTALARMVAEAEQLGAHGVIGIVDASHELLDAGIREFHLVGTAVVLDGEPPSDHVWSTYLAGQRLAKLLEAGFVPMSVVGVVAAVVVVPVCVTEIREAGRYDVAGVVNPEGEIAQLSDAQMAVRRAARDRARHHVGGDTLHGADLRVTSTYLGGQRALVATLSGTRVRQFKAADPLPAPLPTVHLT